MRTIALCLMFALMTACQQKPDDHYVGANNAPLVSELRTLFNADFYDACLNTPPPEIDPATDEPICGPPPSECEALWERRPIGQPDEWDDPEGYAAYNAAWDEWHAERNRMLDQCPLNWEAVMCWPSQMDQALDRVLAKRDKLRVQIRDHLPADERDDLPSELHGLIMEDWACNWWTNASFGNAQGIRFGTPINPPGG